VYMYFAGGEAHAHRLYEFGVRRILASFFYIKRKKKGQGFQYMEDQFSKYGNNL